MLRRLFIAITAVGLVACGFALGTAVMWSGAQITPVVREDPTVVSVPLSVDLQSTDNTDAQLTETEQLFTNLYNQVSPSVVAIYVTFTDDNNQIGSAFGSGFVLDTVGHIVTNTHVVENAEEIEVNFFDGTRVRGEIAGTDPDSDLAVLQVDLSPDRLFPVTLGNSDNLLIGQMTVAIGSPFGQRWTMTTGIISALDRRISGLTEGYSVGGVIQTDAAINPGNSGGPLFDLQGTVIGVNSQIITDSFGIGFAIPSNLVGRVARELIENGSVNYSYLGIRGGEVTDLTLDAMDQFNLPNNLRGVFVNTVDPNGPAAQAGIRASNNDTLEIITAINGSPIGGFSELVAYLAMNTRPGDVVNLTVLRDGAEVVIPVTLGARPAR
jgi:S1-C subfamily serine protease